MLLVFILAAAALIGASLLLQNQQPLTIKVAVDPLIHEWAAASINDFNNSSQIVGAGRRVQVELQTMDDVRVWSGGSNWTGTSHPDAWLPSSSASVIYARDRSLPFVTVKDSIAKTPVIFGGYASRIDVLTGAGQALTWADVINAAEKESWSTLGGQANWQFVKLAFAIPNQTMSGLATILSLAGEHHQATQLTSAELSNEAFRQEAIPVIQSVNFTTIGQDVGAFVARGTGFTDIGIAPESQWLNNLNGLLANETPRFSYPDYVFVFDFPLAQWNDTVTTDEVRQAVVKLGDWMLNNNQQNRLKLYGLRPVSGTLSAADALFADAERYGIQLNPELTNVIQPLALNDLQSLTRWLQTVR